jgi:predicted Zn-dependent protease
MDLLNRIKDRIAVLGFNDYQISRVKKRERQLYLLRGGMESEREVESHFYEVTVYVDHQGANGRSRGSYAFCIKPGEDIDRYLANARTGAALVKNRFYKLPGPAPFPSVDTLDSRLRSPREQAGILAEMIMSRAESKGVILSSAEIFLTTSEIELFTSAGIEAQKEKGLIEVDLTLLSRDADQEAEMHFNLVRRNLDHLRLLETIERHQDFARDVLKVKLPPSRRADVMFDSTMINNLLFPVIMHGSARIKDQGISRLVVGTPVTSEPPKGDALTIISSGILPFGLYSDNFDDEGIPGQEHAVIENGIFRKYMASKQYADYLGLEPTGSFKNMILKPAGSSRPAREIDDYIEIVQFSDLSPDPITGDFVAEIRFGYHHHQGNKTPIKGGSISGNVFQALSDLALSRSEIFSGDYLGPDKVIVRNLSMAGG